MRRLKSTAVIKQGHGFNFSHCDLEMAQPVHQQKHAKNLRSSFSGRTKQDKRIFQLWFLRYLKVKVSYLFGVQVGDSLQDLLEELRGLLLAQRLLFCEEVEELAARHTRRKGEEQGRESMRGGGELEVWHLSDQSQLQIPA